MMTIKKQFLSIITAGLMLGGTSQIKAMNAALMFAAQMVTAITSHVGSASLDKQQIFTQTIEPYNRSFGKACKDGSLIFVRPSNLNPAQLTGEFKVLHIPADVIATTRTVGNLHQPILKEGLTWETVQQEVTTVDITDTPEVNQSQKDYESIIYKEFVRIIDLYAYIVSERIQRGKNPITGASNF